MIVLIVFSLLSIGALAAFFLPPQHRTSQILVSLVPVAALASLLLQLPLPDSFSIPWSPATLFPEPLIFRANPNSTSFAVYLCCLLILIEWTRPLRHSPGRASRMAIYLLTISGIVACFASNPLAVILIWSLVDFLSFLAVLFLKSPVEIGPGGISSSLSHSMGILAINMLGNILLLFAVFLSPSGALLDWNAVGSASSISLSSILFMTGIAFRLLLSPIQFTFSHIQTTSTGVEILLRIVSPAMVLCFLSNVWGSPSTFSRGQAGYSWLIIPLSLVVLMGGWQWAISSSPFGRRDIFFLVLPGFALLSALVFPQPNVIFLAAGAMLILGGGVLLGYIGYLSHRRWMAGFLVLLGLMYSGIPFSPMSVWSASVYPGLFSFSGFPVLVPLFLSHVLVLCAVFRSAFEAVEEFPSNEPLFLFTFTLGMGMCLSFLLFPGWTGGISIVSVAVPILLLLGAILLVFLFRRFQHTGTSLFLFFEKLLRLEWMQKGLVLAFQKTAVLMSGVESFLSGEGAMLWSLGITLLLYLVFRGG